MNQHIKDKYTFAEVNALSRELSLEEKIALSVDVIRIALAKRYHGDELDEKLKELLFCRFETAKEVVKKEMES